VRDIHQYQEQYLREDFEIYKVEYRRKLVLSMVDKYKPRRILEIGCGMQPLFTYLEGTFEKYVFVEPGDIFFHNAIRLAEGVEGVIGYNTFFSADEELEKEMFDMVICSGLLHELEEPQKMVVDIGKICTGKTVVHFNVPNANSFHRLLGMAMDVVKSTKDFSERNIKLQQNTIFDMDALKMLVNMTFDVVDSGEYFIKPFSHDQMMQMIRFGIINRAVLDGLDKMVSFMPGFGSEIYVNCKIKLI